MAARDADRLGSRIEEVRPRRTHVTSCTYIATNLRFPNDLPPNASLTDKMATMNEQMELSEGPAGRERQPRLIPLPSPQLRRTILISLGCGILQLPIWGVQPPFVRDLAMRH